MTFPDISTISIGPDVSNLNGRALDAGALQESAFGIYKVGQGLLTGGSAFAATGLDVKAAANDAALKSAGKLRARYFFLERSNGAAQAQRFMSLTHALGDVAAVGHAIDIEKQNSTYGPLLSDITSFLAEWKTLGGPPLGGYTGRWYWSGYLGNPRWPSDFAWVWDGGTYVTPPNSGDPIQTLQHGGSDHQGVTPGYWNKFGGLAAYTLRQYTSSATFGGITPCDISVFPGTATQLAKIWLSPAPPSPPPNPTPTYTLVTTNEDDDMYVGKNASGLDQWQIAGNSRVYISDVTTLGNLATKFPTITISAAFLNSLPIAGAAPQSEHHAAFAEQLASHPADALRALGYTDDEISGLHYAARRSNSAEENTNE